MKYLLPKDLGGGEVVVLTDQEPTRNYDDYIWVRDSHLGLIQIDRTHLTPVAPPTPEEPPPGAYLIGGLNCLRLAFEDREEPYWVVDHDRQSGWWFTWEELWANFGGPGVTIRPLVALPAVELPWHFDDPSDDSTVEVTKRGNVRICGEIVSLTTAGRREMAAALLSYDAAAGS